MAKKRQDPQGQLQLVMDTGQAPPIIQGTKLVIDWPEVLKVSHSRIKTWRRCQMQHHYRYVQRLRKRKPPTALFIGTGIHSMIEAQVVKGDWTKEMAQFRKEFNHLFAEEREELGDIPTEIEAVVSGYFKRYENDDLIYRPRHRNIVAEIPIDVYLDNRTRFVGYIDKFPVDPEGRSWIMDHKSCKNIPDEESRFSDLQLLMYVWLVPLLGYERPAGVIWDYVRKKAPAVPEVLVKGGISKSSKIDTTYEVYMNTVEKHLGKEALPEYEEFAQTLKGKEEKFYRRIYLPAQTTTMIDNVVKDVKSTIEEIRLHGATAQVRNMTRDCKMCSYYSLCQAEVRGLDSDFIRKADYIVKEQEDGSQEEVRERVGTEE